MGREGPPGQLYLPPGFRFYPTDEELVVEYLCKKSASQPFTVPVIAEVDLYRFDPWDLPEKALFGEKEWYFFSPRDRKYPNGSRPNRAAGSGYWKATGTDKPIYTITNGHKQLAGVKKALVFYIGKAPKGNKTNWIMHEYRLADAGARAAKRKGSLRLDDWVLCRIYKKTMGVQKAAAAAAAAAAVKERNESASCLDEVLASLPDIDDERLMSLPRLNSLKFLIEDNNKTDVEMKDSGENIRRSPPAQNYSWLNITNPNINNNNNNSVPAMMDLGHKDQQFSNITEVECNNNNNNQRRNVVGTYYDNLAAMVSRRPPMPSLMHDSPDEEVQSSFRLHHNENLLQSSTQPLGFGINTQLPTSFTPPPPQDHQVYPLNLVYDNAFLASLGSNYLQKPQ